MEDIGESKNKIKKLAAITANGVINEGFKQRLPLGLLFFEVAQLMIRLSFSKDLLAGESKGELISKTTALKYCFAKVVETEHQKEITEINKG